MSKILNMGKEEILTLRLTDCIFIKQEEFFHIAKTLGAFWSYDRVVAKAGKVGLHAELNSGLHSDGFFASRVLFAQGNMLEIMAWQMSRSLLTLFGPSRPDYLVGVPKGATTLGKEVVRMLSMKEAILEKDSLGNMFFVGEIGASTIAVVEDVCTTGKGFLTAIEAISSSQLRVRVVPYYPVLLNRGGLATVSAEKVGMLKIVPVFERRMNNYAPDSPNGCPLCRLGSKPIKPKATDENWKLLTTSQL